MKGRVLGGVSKKLNHGDRVEIAGEAAWGVGHPREKPQERRMKRDEKRKDIK